MQTDYENACQVYRKIIQTLCRDGFNFIDKRTNDLDELYKRLADVCTEISKKQDEVLEALGKITILGYKIAGTDQIVLRIDDKLKEITVSK